VHHRPGPGRADDPRGRRREAGFTQADVKRGWAIECRINAEDPFRNFLPSTGRLVKFQPPAPTGAAPRPQPAYANGFGGVRVDTGVYEGGEIPMFYDSMIAKLIVHGRTATTPSPRCARAQRLRDPRHQQQHPVPGGAAGPPEVRVRPVQHRLHRRALRQGFKAEDVPHDDPMFLVALAAFIRRKAAPVPQRSAASCRATR
jgi:propionyl-CoA carboxylase alpha chain